MRVDFGKQESTYAAHGDNRGGDSGQVNPENMLPTPQSGVYPNISGYGNDAGNREFSADKAEMPVEFARETAESQSTFTDLQQHLMNSLDTIGSRVAHPTTKPRTPPHGSGAE